MSSPVVEQPHEVEREYFGAWQRTLAKSVEFSGISVHSGHAARLRVNPAPAGNGIVFVSPEGVRIPANIHHLSVNSGELSTNLAKDGVEVATIEHLMAAFAFCGIDNADVVLEGAELPILDGSAEPFIHKFLAAKLTEQAALRHFLVIEESFAHEPDNGSWVRFDPINGVEQGVLQVDVDYRGIIDQVGQQCIRCVMTPEILREELARCRTFGTEKLRLAFVSQGKGLGASVDNAVLYTETGTMNTEPLRFSNEAVRHKALDLVGDLFLAGWPLLGHISASRPGHQVNADALKALLASGKYRLEPHPRSMSEANAKGSGDAIL